MKEVQKLELEKLIEETAQVMYCDSYTQYGTCSKEKWDKTSDTQREFFKSQAVAVMKFLQSKGFFYVK
jgi:hypothetical protein